MTEDWELLNRWVTGDKRAGNALLERYFGILSRFFHNKVADAEDVADLISETLLACTKNKESIREGKSFRSYLFATALNQLRGYYRKKRKRGRERDDFLDFCTADLDRAHTMTSMIARKRETTLLVQALRSIPLEYQIALELNMFEGLTGRAIGELLGVPTGTVHSRLRRGKERLSAEVEKLAASPEEYRSTMTDLAGWARQLRDKIDATS
ncbi:MAG: sigma-70 family RNA polymerase sigma factor [Myxococcales bacterium]|nr:sigma-70 family RNA polymerase sigma factor [Myxococcales bacterium]MCB9753577.1 sigma-70 family RNA polymerase sigma factor [Myxococcales bacterium]